VFVAEKNDFVQKRHVGPLGKSPREPLNDHIQGFWGDGVEFAFLGPFLERVFVAKGRASQILILWALNRATASHYLRLIGPAFVAFFWVFSCIFTPKPSFIPANFKDFGFLISFVLIGLIIALLLSIISRLTPPNPQFLTCFSRTKHPR